VRELSGDPVEDKRIQVRSVRERTDYERLELEVVQNANDRTDGLGQKWWRNLVHRVSQCP
jgi:hypothetical protein